MLKKRLYNFETITDLRHQYESEIENIRRLQALCEERVQAEARARENEIQEERAKNAILELKLAEHSKYTVIIQQLNEKVEELEKNILEKKKEIEEFTQLCNSLTAERNSSTSQLDLINHLFSNMLIGDVNFDLLIQQLQDHHNLITDLIADEEINDTIALLVSITEKTYENEKINPLVSSSPQQKIAENLPKVWRMLIELLCSYDDAVHAVQCIGDNDDENVEASTNSRTVSVSQTILRLKDLISEKSSLANEISRLKTLNEHVENRLNQQEKRLRRVLPEIRTTWDVASQLDVQHKQLHTRQKILGHGLQHKRQMLTELKKELEYCRETWNRVKEKNSLNEHDYDLLQIEFAFRESFDKSNSVESGFDDDENIHCSELDGPSFEDVSTSSEVSPVQLKNESECQDSKVDSLFVRPPHESAQPSTSVIECSDDKIVFQPFECPLANIEPIIPPQESSDQGSSSGKPGGSQDILGARTARLRLLDEQCQSLLNQMALTSLHSDTLSTRLEKLHEKYGSEEHRSSCTGETNPRPADVTNDESSDCRQSRVQQMEQNYMHMMENNQNSESESTPPG